MSLKKQSLLIINSLVMLLTASAGFGLTADNKQLAHFTSHKAIYNYKSHTTTFLGSVLMVQGSTQLKADKVIAYRNEAGQIYKMLAYGNPSHYKTLPDDDKRELLASAKIIKYYPDSGIAFLINDATVQQGKNKIHSQRIIYNRTEQRMTTFADENTQTSIVINPSNPPRGSKQRNSKNS